MFAAIGQALGNIRALGGIGHNTLLHSLAQYGDSNCPIRDKALSAAAVRQTLGNYPDIGWKFTE